MSPSLPLYTLYTKTLLSSQAALGPHSTPGLAKFGREQELGGGREEEQQLGGGREEEQEVGVIV